MGRKCRIDTRLASVRLSGNSSASYVFSCIEPVRPLIINICHKVSHITITNCSNLIIKLINTSVAGIECINSNKVNISVKTITFLRITTGSEVNVCGLCDSSTILDVRNSINVKVNNDNIPISMFSESRFCYKEEILYRMRDNEDIFSSGNLSLPNISLLKKHRTGKY